MRIVQQLASLSYCPFPALPAPHIAGLLPAHAESTPHLTVIQPRESLLDRQRALWTAQDAELEAFLHGARQRLLALRAEIAQESRRHGGALCLI